MCNYFLRTFATEARKKAIQESKFLGGDLQHTHLVKGLDYVLLDKVLHTLSTLLTQLYMPASIVVLYPLHSFVHYFNYYK